MAGETAVCLQADLIACDDRGCVCDDRAAAVDALMSTFPAVWRPGICAAAREGSLLEQRARAVQDRHPCRDDGLSRCELYSRTYYCKLNYAGRCTHGVSIKAIILFERSMRKLSCKALADVGHSCPLIKLLYIALIRYQIAKCKCKGIMLLRTLTNHKSLSK